MNDITILLLALGTGCLIGTIFYGGLWWTIQKGILSPHPELWFFCSFWLRIAIALAGFYAVADGDWKRQAPGKYPGCRP